jgi:hypothetical protein
MVQAAGVQTWSDRRISKLNYDWCQVAQVAGVTVEWLQKAMG